MNVETSKKETYISITSASVELKICISNISDIRRKKKSHKTATSKKDGNKYTFEYVNKKITAEKYNISI